MLKTPKTYEEYILNCDVNNINPNGRFERYEWESLRTQFLQYRRFFGLKYKLDILRHNNSGKKNG
jgi:hypothetical protein